MTGRPHRLAWLPPLLVGASAAIAGEVALALLLYAGPGFVRSLTVILGVAGLSWSAGLWSAPSGPGVDGLRRRWHLCLLAFVAATAFGVAWSVWDVLASGRAGQAIGLAVLLALPLYATGTLLGGLSAVASTTGAQVRVGAAAALGAGLGAVLTGLLLPRTPLPATVLLSCMVLLSLGGVVFGLIADTTTSVKVRAEAPSPGGVVRVEEHRHVAEGLSECVLMEGDHERRRVSLAGEGEAPWDVSLARALMPDAQTPWRVLAVGSGASPVAASVVREHPSATIDVLERSAAVVALACERFDTGLDASGAERVRLSVGNLEDLLKALRERYDLVLVDAGVLGAIGGAGGLSREALGRIVQAVTPGGWLAWGPTAPEDGVPALATAWSRTTFERDRDEGREAPTPAGQRIVLLRRSAGADAVPVPVPSVEGFMSRNGAPADS